MEIIKSSNSEYQKIAENLLYLYDNKYGTSDYYRNRTAPTDCKTFGFYVDNGEEILGGAVVYQAWDWLFVDTLAIKEEYQKQNIGRRLFEYIDDYCRNQNLVGIKLSTMDFQARGFYEKMGFKVICEIKNCPRGNTKYELVKYLEGDNSDSE